MGDPVDPFEPNRTAGFYCEVDVSDPSPDGLRDYRPHLVDDHHPVGVGDTSEEQSGDVGHVFRAAPGTPLTRPRSCMPGEIGWGIPWLTDWAAPTTRQQIVLGDFRQIAEDRSTHENMGAWYPGPNESTRPGSHGFYRENIYSGRPGTSNVRFVRSSFPWRPRRTQSRHSQRRQQTILTPEADPNSGFMTRR